MPPPPEPCLAVEKKPFLEALKSLRISIRARQKDEATISFENGFVHIKLLDSVVRVPATGCWTGSARVVARTLIPIVTFPPDPDPLPLRFHDERFFIAGWSVNGTWHGDEWDEFGLPENANCLDMAALRRRFTEEELDDSGLLQNVRNAEKTIRAQVAQAAKALGPVGITEGDLQGLVERKLDDLVRG